MTARDSNGSGKHRIVQCILLFAFMYPGIAAAHTVNDENVHGWNPDPVLLSLLLVTVAWYFTGMRRMWRRSVNQHGELRRKSLLFGGAMLALVIALISPLDALSAQLASAHMVQHMLLIIVAAPLFVLAAPLPAFLWAVPARARQRLAGGSRQRLVSSTWRFLTLPLVAWLLHGMFLWLWHVPALYEAALHNRLLHDVEHASFLANSLLFWWVVLRAVARSGGRNGAAILLLFTTFMHGGLLAALMTFSTSPWYPSYANGAPDWALSAVEDQQLAGLIMWLPAGMTYMVAGLILLSLWMRRLEQQGSVASGGPA